jgi:hypothetical protein
MKKVALTLIAALVLFGANEARAQGETVQANASITIPTLLTISGSGTTVEFPQPSFADFAAGSIAATGTTVINTRGNVLHRVTVQANTEFMTAGPYDKRSADLEWSLDGIAGFEGLTPSPVNVVTHLSPRALSQAAEVWYRMLLDETVDLPGTYNLAFTYTVLPN